MNKSKPITGLILQELREYLALNQLDAVWVFGASLQAWNSKKEKEPTGTSLAILSRIYDKHPELVPLPKYPTYNEMYNLMSPYYFEYYGKKLPHTVMGTLFGVGKWAGHNWSRNVEMAPVAKRLFLVAKEMIEANGKRGFVEYLEFVETEAKARGFNDIEHVYIDGWKNRQLKEKLISESA